MSIRIYFRQIPDRLLPLALSQQKIAEVLNWYAVVDNQIVSSRIPGLLRYHNDERALIFDRALEEIKNSPWTQQNVFVFRNLLKDFPELSQSFQFENLDRAWNLLHFVLTGTNNNGEPPLCNAVMGGQASESWFGFEFWGVNSKQVTEVAHALSQLDFQSLFHRYDPKEFVRHEISGCVDMENTSPEELKKDFEWLSEKFNVLSKYYSDVATSGQAIVKWLG